ncbi:hypothetical protein ACQEUU_29725 [Nonomuraea sp. CA-218870]|uniref:hypothetical protein n=1 Tax=Nonomuraea sp. CA-218870 TaxID=3239998 RepID=UPI003D918704
MIVINNTWQRVALAALLIAPVILIVILMTPALLVLPFFATGREFILKLFDKMTTWARVVLPKAEAK